MTPHELRTPDVAAVLDYVRLTGRSAHPTLNRLVSDTVFRVAVDRGRNPVELQREVTAYADALDAIGAANETSTRR